MGALCLDQGARAHRRPAPPSSTPSCGRSCSASTSTTPRSRAMRQLHAEVRREVARRELAEHVKLGPGGIREIEFIAQALQLVRGGRDPELRVRADAAGAARCSRERICCRAKRSSELAAPTPSCATSSTACSTSTTRSATTCPQDGEDRSRACRACAGFRSWHAFYDAARARIATAVSRHFDAVFAEPEAAGRSRGRSIRASPRCARASAMPRCPTESSAASTRLIPALARAARATPDRGGDARARRRPGRGDRQPRRVPRAARRAPARRSSASRASSAPRAGRPSSSPAIRCCSTSCSTTGCSTPRSTSRRSRAQPARAARRARRRRRAAHGTAARGAPGGRCSACWPRTSPACSRSSGSPTIFRRSPTWCSRSRIELAWDDLRGRAPRGRAALRGHRLRQARRQGARLRLRPRHHLPLRRCRTSAQPRSMRGSRSGCKPGSPRRTSAGMLFDTDLAAAPERRVGPDGVLARGVRALPGARRLGLGAPGADARALLRRRRGGGRGLRDHIGEKILRREPRPGRARARKIIDMREKMHAAHPEPLGAVRLKHDRGGMIDVEFAVQYLVLAFSSQFRR